MSTLLDVKLAESPAPYTIPVLVEKKDPGAADCAPNNFAVYVFGNTFVGVTSFESSPQEVIVNEKAAAIAARAKNFFMIS
jgi:hypothetical protein